MTRARTRRAREDWEFVVLRNLAVALLVVVAMVGALVLFVVRNDAPSDGGPAAPAVPTPADPGRAAARARGALEQIAEASQRLMPEGYDAVYLTMPLDALRRARPRTRRDPSAAGRRGDGVEVWEEDDPSGARVVYLVSSRAGLLTQVQFASRLADPAELRPHFEAMTGRYGRPTGVWDCPETEEASAMRRLTWRREGASVMEAVLLYGSTIALTLVVAPTEDVGRALQRSRCQPVRSDEALANFPVARALRGQQTPFVREVRRDE